MLPESYPFENDVKTYSIQTEKLPISAAQMFENDVKTYSIQTATIATIAGISLRMM